MIASPCIDTCCLNEEDICLGCFRSLEEILAWRAATDTQKQLFLDFTVCRKEAQRCKYSLACSANKSPLGGQ